MRNTKQLSDSDCQHRLITVARVLRLAEVYQDYLEKYPAGTYSGEAVLFLASGIRILESQTPLDKTAPAIGATPTDQSVACTSLPDLSASAADLQRTLTRGNDGSHDADHTGTVFFATRWLRGAVCRFRALVHRVAWTCFEY